METSAKEKINVDKVFVSGAEHVLRLIDSGEINPYEEFGIKIGRNSQIMEKKSVPKVKLDDSGFGGQVGRPLYRRKKTCC